MSISALIWSTAELLRGDYKQSDYGRVILPFTLLRRLECVLDATRDAVISSLDAHQSMATQVLSQDKVREGLANIVYELIVKGLKAPNL